LPGERSPAEAKGVALTPLKRTIDEAGLHYGCVDVQCNREARTATITVRAPESVTEHTLENVTAAVRNGGAANGERAG